MKTNLITHAKYIVIILALGIALMSVVGTGPIISWQSCGRGMQMVCEDFGCTTDQMDAYGQKCMEEAGQ